MHERLAMMVLLSHHMRAVMSRVNVRYTGQYIDYLLFHLPN
jgi:hypothetical protein